MHDLPFKLLDLGVMPYAAALAVQRQHLEEVLASREAGTPEVGRVLLVEHPPVITVSARPDAASHLLADSAMLAAHGVSLEQTDRGGDITYHGPGQLVAYPILDLNVLRLRIHDYMRLLEAAVIETCGVFNVPAMRDSIATGVWVPSEADPTAAHAKICAMGVRVRKWASMHGLALNVRTNLDHFGLIVPCGLVGRPVTSLHQILADNAPSMDQAKRALVESLAKQIRDRLVPTHP